jgi:hypothetical protein
VEALRLDQLAHCVGIFGGHHLIAVGAEIFGDRVPEVGFVLDYCDPYRHGNHASAIGGK